MFSQLCLKIKSMCLISSSSMLPAAFREPWGSAVRKRLQECENAGKLGEGWQPRRNPADKLSWVHLSWMSSGSAPGHGRMERGWPDRPGLIVTQSRCSPPPLCTSIQWLHHRLLKVPLTLFFSHFSSTPSLNIVGSDSIIDPMLVSWWCCNKSPQR